MLDTKYILDYYNLSYWEDVKRDHIWRTKYIYADTKGWGPRVNKSCCILWNKEWGSQEDEVPSVIIVILAYFVGWARVYGYE